jgi:hypothetical protein
LRLDGVGGDAAHVVENGRIGRADDDRELGVAQRMQRGTEPCAPSAQTAATQRQIVA